MLCMSKAISQCLFRSLRAISLVSTYKSLFCFNISLVTTNLVFIRNRISQFFDSISHRCVSRRSIGIAFATSISVCWRPLNFILVFKTIQNSSFWLALRCMRKMACVRLVLYVKKKKKFYKSKIQTLMCLIFFFKQSLPSPPLFDVTWRYFFLL